MPTTVRAEMPATVWQVRVQVGDQVDVDDELVVLESMKMEIPVGAPRSGVVTAVHVAASDRVTEGDPLADID
jgi:acetyl-CoA carboxylase biotin carboxyl carrier protein